jgi:hypothetical protein
MPCAILKKPVKTVFFNFIFLFFCSQTFAQITNIKPGNWSDNSVWSNNTIPTGNDDVLLNFDIVIDISTSCQSLSTNGHLVTVNAGVNLEISGHGGNTGDTLLSRYVEVDLFAAAPFDTIMIINFTYDTYKRNTGIHTQYFTDGILNNEYNTYFFYQDSSRVPFKKELTTLFSESGEYFSSNNYYFYQNSQLITDSAGSGSTTVNTNHYTYRSDSVLSAAYYYDTDPPGVYLDSARVAYLNGNLVSQVQPPRYVNERNFSYVYNDHPNPFYYTQNKLVFSYSYPLYSFQTYVEEIFTKNNVVTIHQTGEDVYNSDQVYEYQANGYPKTVYIASTFGNSSGLYFYTH